jgi:hypothetical protein
MDMIEVLSGGPYYVFGRPLILKIMLEFFLFYNFWNGKDASLG